MCFIEESFANCGQNPQELIQTIGNQPAMRRTMRMWVMESVDNSEYVLFDQFCSALLNSDQVSPYWKDEIIVGIMLSQNSKDLIQRQSLLLLDNNNKFLFRLIHLLRVACKAPNLMLISQLGLNEIDKKDSLAMQFLRPVGSGWASVIEFIHTHLVQINLERPGIILGLIEDWAGTISIWSGLPPSAREAGLIAIHLFKNTISTSEYLDEHGKNILKNIIKFSAVIKDEIQDFVNDYILDDKTCPRISDDMANLMVNTFDCAQLCEHLPDVTIRLAQRAWYKNGEASESWYHRLDMEDYFGLKTSVDLTPIASGYHGPFMHLLRSHPVKGITFIIDFINYTTREYTKSDLAKRDGHVNKVAIKLNDGTVLKQLANDRLWNLYRGTSVGPLLVESALMALENYLFDLMETDVKIDHIIDFILHRSESCSLSAVLTSMAIAYPNQLGEAILPLLQVKEYIEWDFLRAHKDQNHIDDIRPLMGAPTGGTDDVFYKEREKSSKRPHRKKNLEDLILNLQMTSFKDKVWDILDNYRVCLQMLSERTDSDNYWEMKLRKIDIREYDVREDTDNAQILFVPKELPKELEDFRQHNLENIESRGFLKCLSLLAWGRSRFDRDNQPNNNFNNWQEAYDVASELLDNHMVDSDDNIMSDQYWAAITYVAAVCLRDYHDELDMEQLKKCTLLLIFAIVKDANGFFDLQLRVDRASFDGARPAANILPLLLASNRVRWSRILRLAIVTSLTHPCLQIRHHAIIAVHEHLWSHAPEFMRRCITGMIELARIEMDYRDQLRVDSTSAEKAEALNAINRLRKCMARRQHSLKGIAAISFDTHSEYDIIYPVAMILPDSMDEDQFSFIMSVSKEFVLQDRMKEEHRNGRINYEIVYQYTRLLARIVVRQDEATALNLCKPFLEAVGYSKYILEQFLISLTSEAGVQYSKSFWAIWEAFYLEAVKKRTDKSGRYWYLNNLIRNLLFDKIPWKSDTEICSPLSDRPEFYSRIAKEWGEDRDIFAAIVRLTYYFRKSFLPIALLWISNVLEKPGQNQRRIFNGCNTAYFLERVLLSILNDPILNRTVRENVQLKTAAVYLLDALVDNGSSLAFQIRERMVMTLPCSAFTYEKKY